jgi:uncharacterized protein DUF4430
MFRFETRVARTLRFRPTCGVMLAILLGSIPLTTAAAAQKTATVQLVVDYGDGAELRFKALPWKEGMTVLDALNAAKAHRHGITFVTRGKGSSTLVTKIGDQANEGDGKNWLYSVNEKRGEVSAGAQKVEPQDTILWRFEVYE